MTGVQTCALPIFVSFLEGKLSPTNAKDEKSRGKVGAQVVKSRDEVENQVLKSRKEVEDEARVPTGIQVLAYHRGYAGGTDFFPLFAEPPAGTAMDTLIQVFLRRDPAVQRFPDLYADRSGRCHVVRVKGRVVTSA